MLLHIATCSGPARAAERASPCGRRVKVVHASLHGSSFVARHVSVGFSTLA